MAADLRTFAAHGGFGTAVVTALTAQDEAGVQSVEPVQPALVGAQLRSALATGPSALKTGMLATRGILEAIAEILAEGLAEGLGTEPTPPLVVDPVLVAGTGGRPLLEEEAVDLLAPRLAPYAALLTPNLPEAARLLGRSSIEAGDEPEAGRALLSRGWRAVLLKGGHGRGATAVDLLFTEDGEHGFERERLPGPTVHGTGCALSAAIAARLGRGEGLVEAVGGAGDWLHGRIAAALATGAGRLPA